MLIAVTRYMVKKKKNACRLARLWMTVLQHTTSKNTEVKIIMTSTIGYAGTNETVPKTMEVQDVYRSAG